MYRSTIGLCLVALTISVPLAAKAAQPQGERISVVGAYTSGLVQDFFPCDRHERWSVSDQSGLTREYASLVTEAGQPFFVQASGYISPPGHYGRLGGNERSLVITDYTVTLNPPRDCVLYGE